ncbi:MAG: sensory box protein [Gammaproteobacteria bacterium]|nr:MAG: sensory box protein [Gammaproteobacteria bacterium]
MSLPMYAVSATRHPALSTLVSGKRTASLAESAHHTHGPDRASPESRSPLPGTDVGETRFRKLLESAPDAIVIVDDAGIIEIINQKTEELFGYPRDELIGKSVDGLLPARFRGHHAQSRAGYTADPYRRPMGAGMDLFGLRKDGSEFPAEISLSPMESEGKRHVTAIIRDISDRKAAEAALKEHAAALARSNNALEQFAYVASHDLQEPLRMVTSYLQLLSRRYTGRLDADADEFIGYAVDGATRMRNLIEDLLTYSRVTRKAKEFVPTDCTTVLKQAARNLELAVEESGAVITHDELPTVMADDIQLVQLFQNLISNAIKYRSAASPEIHISAARQNNDWLFRFRDNGIGIDPRFNERIFEIFKTLHPKHQFVGTGIGLAICQRIVERHGGRIWVDSIPGHGSTFCFTLPRGDAENFSEQHR